MKAAREKMDMIAAYREVGSYRGAAAMCGTTPKTVRRAVERVAAGPDLATSRSRGARRARNTDDVAELVRSKVQKTKGRISAKRLLPIARADGYSGSARNFRRLVAEAKAAWREQHHRGRRPGVWESGETLVIDWGQEGALHVFCAVMAHSRYRFVRFAADERSETTLRLLAECFEDLGAVPHVVLADRMGCLKGAVVANVVVPTPAYVRFAAHYGFRPDFCEAADPASKGIVENLVGYAKADLVVPGALLGGDLDDGAARRWCAEVNATVHSETAAVPAERLEVERPLMGPLPSLRPALGAPVLRRVDRLSCVRYARGRYSVPLALIAKTVEVRVDDGELVIVHLGKEMARHRLVAAGESSIDDAHYGGPRPRPRRAVRPKGAAEQAICALGPVGEAFIKAAAAAGATRLGVDLPAICALEAAHGKEALTAALERAVAFGRFGIDDVRSILLAGPGVASPRPAGAPLEGDFPEAATRPLSDYKMGSAS